MKNTPADTLAKQGTDLDNLKKCKKCGAYFPAIDDVCPSCGGEGDLVLPEAPLNNTSYSGVDQSKAETAPSKTKGSFWDIFKVSKIKARNAELENELERVNTELSNLRASITPEMWEVEKLRQLKTATENEIESLKSEVAQIQKDKEAAVDIVKSILKQIEEKKQLIIETDEKILLQEFGLYEPQYDFISSETYKERLALIREKQKTLIKTDSAVIGAHSWTVNGSESQGKKMIKDMQKLILRAFNSECDSFVEKVKYNTYDTYVKRIESSCNAISKLGKIMSISISDSYKNLKIEELTLAFEYRQKKQEEKEAQKELRAQMREEAKLQKEIEEARKKLDKEQTHYEKALATIMKQLETADENMKADLLSKKQEIEDQLGEISKAKKDVDYREANAKAGYVYVISNIGAFGENVYKIGMTRRLDPTERIDELSDASVPFNFDIHAMIFSDDAPKLEAALHKAFEDRKVNMVNQRREFFRVTLDEIKEVVKANFDKTVEFIDVAEAEQYRTSEKMRAAKTQHPA